MGLIPKSFYERALMLDSGPLISLYIEEDSRKESVKKNLNIFGDQKYPLCITNLTIAEVQRRIIYDDHIERGINFLDDIYDGSMNILEIENDDIKMAISIIKKFNDQKISFTDSITMAVMKRLGILKVYTYDIHFTYLGYVLIQ